MRTKGFKNTMTGVVAGAVAGLLLINYNNRNKEAAKNQKGH